jgi:hypothetical protein
MPRRARLATLQATEADLRRALVDVVESGVPIVGMEDEARESFLDRVDEFLAAGLQLARDVARAGMARARASVGRLTKAPGRGEVQRT